MKRTDRDLIEEILGGRPESYDELMQRYEKLVYRVALLYAGTRENALDISQNVFLKAYRSLEGFRAEASFRTWLLRIAYNEGVDWVRRHRGDAAGEPLEPEGHLPAPLTDRPAQEARVLSRERRWLLVQKIGELNTRQRLAVSMRYFRQMPLREIALVLQCNENHVKNILFRGVRRLQQSLAGTGIEE